MLKYVPMTINNIYDIVKTQMERAGWQEFALDCLSHNLRAKNLYHSLGFKEIKEIVGFDGTDHSTVEAVSFLGKKVLIYLLNFKMLK